MNDLELAQVNLVDRSTNHLQRTTESVELVEKLYIVMQPSEDDATLIELFLDSWARQSNIVHAFGLLAKLEKSEEHIGIKDQHVSALLELYLKQPPEQFCSCLRHLLFKTPNAKITLKIFEKGYLQLIDEYWMSSGYVDCLVELCKSHFDCFVRNIPRIKELLLCNLGKDAPLAFSRIASLISVNAQYQAKMFDILKENKIIKHLLSKHNFIAALPLITELTVYTGNIELLVRHPELIKAEGCAVLPYFCKSCAELCFGHSIFLLGYKIKAGIRRQKFLQYFSLFMTQFNDWQPYFKEMYSISHQEFNFVNSWLPSQDLSEDESKELYYEMVPLALRDKGAEMLATEHAFFIVRLAACNARYFSTRSNFFLCCMLQIPDVRIWDNSILKQLFFCNFRYYIAAVSRKPYRECYLNVMYTSGRDLQTEECLLTETQLGDHFSDIRAWTAISGGIVDLIIDIHARYLFCVVVEEKFEIVDKVLRVILRLLNSNILLEANERLEYVLTIIYLEYNIEGQKGALVAEIIEKYCCLLRKLQINHNELFTACFSNRKSLILYLEETNIESLNEFCRMYFLKCAPIDKGIDNILLITIFQSKIAVDESLIRYFCKVISRYLPTDRQFALFELVFPDTCVDGLIKHSTSFSGKDRVEWLQQAVRFDFLTRYDSALMRIYKLMLAQNEIGSEELLQDRMFSSYVVLLSQIPFSRLRFCESATASKISALIDEFMRSDSLLLAFHGLVISVERGCTAMAFKYSLPFLRLFNLIEGVETLYDFTKGCTFAHEIISLDEQVQIPFSQFIEYCYNPRFVEFITNASTQQLDNELEVAALMARRLFLRNYYIAAFCKAESAFLKFSALSEANRFKVIDVSSVRHVLDYYASNVELIGSSIAVCFFKELCEHIRKLQDASDLFESIILVHNPQLIAFCCRCVASRKSFRFDDCNYYFQSANLLSSLTNEIFCISRLDYLAFEDKLRILPEFDADYASRVCYDVDSEYLNDNYFKEPGNQCHEYFFVSALYLLRSFMTKESSAYKVLTSKIHELLDDSSLDFGTSSRARRAAAYVPGVLHLVRVMGEGACSLRTFLQPCQITIAKEALAAYNETYFNVQNESALSDCALPHSHYDEEVFETSLDVVLNHEFVDRQLLVDELFIIDAMDSTELFDYFKQQYVQQKRIIKDLTHFSVLLYCENCNFMATVLNNEVSFSSEALQSSEQSDVDLIEPLVNQDAHENGAQACRFKTAFRLFWIEDLIVYMAERDVYTTTQMLLSFVGNIEVDKEDNSIGGLQNYEHISGFAARHLIALTKVLQNDTAVLQCFCAVAKRGCYTDSFAAIRENPFEKLEFLTQNAVCASFTLPHNKYTLFSKILGVEVSTFTEFMEEICRKFPNEQLAYACDYLLKLSVKYSVFTGYIVPWIDSESYMCAVEHEAFDEMLYELPRILSEVELCSIYNKTQALRAVYYMLRHLLKQHYEFSLGLVAHVFALSYNLQHMELSVEHEALDEVIDLVWRVIYALTYSAILTTFDHFKLLLEFLEIRCRQRQQLTRSAVAVLLVCELIDEDKHVEHFEGFKAFINTLELSAFLNLVEKLGSAEIRDEARAFLLECGMRQEALEFDIKNIRSKLEGRINAAEMWIERLVIDNFKLGRPELSKLEAFCKESLDLSCKKAHLDIEDFLTIAGDNAEPSMAMFQYYSSSENEFKALCVLSILHCYIHGCKSFANIVIVMQFLQEHSSNLRLDIERFIAKLVCQEHTSNDLMEGVIFDIEKLFELIEIEVDENSVQIFCDIACCAAFKAPCVLTLAWLAVSDATRQTTRDVLEKASFMSEWDHREILVEKLRELLAKHQIRNTIEKESENHETLMQLYANASRWL